MPMDDRRGWSEEDYLAHCASHGYDPGEAPYSFPSDKSEPSDNYQESELEKLFFLSGTWIHEHPVALTVSAIAAAGAASGLGYMLYQYFSR